MPFCQKKCPYCDFYSVAYDKDIASSFIDVLSSQIEQLPDDFSTIFIGGGTPTVLSRRLLSKVLKSLDKKIKNKFQKSTLLKY